MKNVIKIIAILFLFSACEQVPFFSSSGDSTPISLELEMTSSDIKTLQDIEADFTVTNVSDDQVTYGFKNSCQHGFIVERNENKLFDSTGAIGCLQVITELKLEPEQSKTYQISLEGMQGSDSLEVGTYKLKAFLQNERSPKVNTTFVVE
jgi:hypothetical protein